MEHETFMREALSLAREAAARGEVPVGCVIVRGGEIVGRGRNRREEKQSAASHAELEAIADANARLGSWRLEDCALYVTLEPCPMCAGAMAWAQLGRVVYGAPDQRRGYSIFTPSLLHPRTEAVGGILQEECVQLMLDFFKDKRS